MMSNDIKGIVLAIISGASFGLIPLFTIPLIAEGMGNVSIIFYRFFFGSIFMLAVMLFRQQSLRIGWSEFWRISILSLIYIICAVTLFTSYNYISSGVATSLIYTNPIWCSLIGLVFLKERLSVSLFVAMVMAVIGVMMLSGFFDENARFSLYGIFLGLCSGIGYGIYLVVLPRLRLKKMPSLKFTFYIFSLALLYLVLYSAFFEGGIEVPLKGSSWLNLILVGLLPTAFSNICVTMALRLINTTVVAILGAFEPFTALIIGIIVFDEPYSFVSISGCIMVLIAVILATIKGKP